MMLTGWLPSLAHGFEVDGVFYNKLNSSEVAVTYKGEAYNDYSNEYAGDVVIPSSVNYRGTTYSVTSIGESAFYECSSLTSIQIPNSVTSIGNSAFYDCESLTSIQIPNSVTSIGDEAFCGCESLTSIVVDSGNAVYDSRNGCNAIIKTASNTLIVGCQNTIIPNSVTSIGEGAFYNCSSLTSIQIPNSVTSIGDAAFYNCSSLTSIQIPNSVTSIGVYVFYYCSSLTSVEIGNSVTSIGYGAFYNCSSLTSIEIPNSVTSIGYYAFEDCSSLTSVEIGNSVTSIGYCAFWGCESLTSIEIGNSVTSIGEGAFDWCYSLTKITCLATNPPAIVSTTFSNYSAELYVPTGCKAAYEVADNWENFNNIIEVTLDAPVTLNDNNAIVATIGENIVVKNAMVGSVVRVYTADGAMIASEVATEGDVVIEAPVKGIYVVKVGKQTVKVII